MYPRVASIVRLLNQVNRRHQKQCQWLTESNVNSTTKAKRTFRLRQMNCRTAIAPSQCDLSTTLRNDTTQSACIRERIECVDFRISPSLTFAHTIRMATARGQLHEIHIQRNRFANNENNVLRSRSSVHFCNRTHLHGLKTTIRNMTIIKDISDNSIRNKVVSCR